MSDAELKLPWHRYRDAMSASTKLIQKDDNEGALRLLDDAIAMAMREQENQWVLTLSHHAAVLANFLGDPEREKNYYQESLSFNPENPSALLGLAKVAKKQREPEVAKGYAARCYKALMHGDDFLKDARLETLLKEWPDIAEQ
jgi:tetratricopeptide (TPR) repeat protein